MRMPLQNLQTKAEAIQTWLSRRVEWQRLGLRSRLLLSMAVLMAAFGAAIAVALWQLHVLAAQLELSVERDGRRTEMAHRLNAALLEVGMQQRTLLTLTDPGDLEAQKDLLDEATQRYLSAEKKLAELPVEADDRTQAFIAEKLKEIRETRSSIATMHQEAVRSMMEGRGAEAALGLLLPAETAEQQWRQGIAGIVQFTTDANIEAQHAAQSRQKRASVIILGTAMFAVVLGVFLAIRLSTSITVRIAAATASAEQMATGNLAVRFEPRSASKANGHHDEVGRLQNAVATLQEKLREIVSGLRSSAELVSISSEEITAGSHELSSRTEIAAARLQETSGTVRELADRVTQTAMAAKMAEELAQRAKTQASAGGLSIVRANEDMQRVGAAMASMADIVELIQGIAQQTHMLSLNAAVEAARAGDAGRGFSVVAAEVRGLAQRAADAVLQIKALSAEAGSQVARGSQQVEQAGAAAQALDEMADQVARTVQAITGDMQEQAKGLKAVDEAIHELDSMTQHNAAMSEQSAAAASSMNGQATQLVRLVQMFKLQGE